MKVVFAYVMSCCLSCLAPSLGKVIDVMAQRRGGIDVIVQQKML